MLRLLVSLAALALLLAVTALAARAAQPVIPVHGTVLAAGPNGTVVVRTDPVTGTLPSLTRAYRVEPALHLTPGVGVDAFLDRSSTPWRLYHAAIAARFAAGLPDPGKVVAIDYGSALPHTKLVDQQGRLVDLASSFRGRVVLLSFVFTRCPDKDECPTVSAKFGYLQQHLDPNRFHLVEMTLDPVYDSPSVLAAYGKQFGADPRSWSIVTGQPHEIAHLLDRFGISSLRVSDAAFIHNDKVFLSTRDGKIADIVQTVGFSPSSMVAQAHQIAGMTSSPFGRFELSLIANVAALCGGSQYAGVVLLETALFLLIAVASFITLGWIARKFWKNA